MQHLGCRFPWKDAVSSKYLTASRLQILLSRAVAEALNYGKQEDVRRPRIEKLAYRTRRRYIPVALRWRELLVKLNFFQSVEMFCRCKAEI